MIERRLGAERRGGRREAALMLGEGIGIEHILLRHVLHMHEGIGVGDACPEGARRRDAFAAAPAP